MQPSHRTRPARPGLFLSTLLLLSTAGCGGDEATDATTIAEDATEQELLTELQGIQQELSMIQQQALQNPALQDDRDSLERQLEAEIRELDPEVEAKRERRDTIASEFETAREEGDEASAQELAAEGQRLQASLQQTRQRAMGTADMRAAIESFQEDMLAAMQEVDPRTDSLVARAEAIVAHLQERMAQEPATLEGPAPDSM